MLTRLLCTVLASLGVVALVALKPHFGDYPKLSPFTAIRWHGGAPDVEVRSHWYSLVSIDAVKSTEIVSFCHRTYGDIWQKRFDEDLVEVLTTMQHKPGKKVDLELVDIDTKKSLKLEGIEMTHENRQAIWMARNAASASSAAKAVAAEALRVHRDHAAAPSPAFRALAARADAAPGAPELSRKDAKEDLDQLEWILEQRFSYRDKTGLDYRAALDAIRASLGDSIPVTSFGIQLYKLIALFGDGHSSVSAEKGDLLPGKCAPFLVGESGGGESGGRLVAFRADRSSLLSPAHPFLAKIDGLPVAKWLDAARSIVPQGSPQYVRRASSRNLRFIEWLRGEMGLARKSTIDVELESADGKQRTSISLEVTAEKPVYGEWPRTKTKMLDGNVGYLRIAEMKDEPEFVEAVMDDLKALEDTRGLILDVRGNGGGSRDLLRALFPCFMAPQDAPRLVNVAARRVGEGEECGGPEGCLQDRFLYPSTSKSWSPAERSVVENAAREFKAEWLPSPAEFSPWHYLVISRPAQADLQRYEHPVIVLMDSSCFSATDIFLGAFKGWRNVTLIGAPSGGGSGRAGLFTLEHSHLVVRLSSMVSFRPDGQLYDGNGVQPDVAVDPAPEDFTGASDAVLDAALKKLR